MRRNRNILLPASLGLAVLACTTLKSTPPGARSKLSQEQEDVLSILPPGQRGNYSKSQFDQYMLPLVGSRLPNSADQRDMYMALGTQVAMNGPASLTEESLTQFFKTAPLHPDPADVVSTETPSPGVTIKRDRFGVPYIYGKTNADVAFGAGYATTQDRMFAQDIARHLASARLAEFLGLKVALQVDASVLGAIDYSPQEAEQQVEDLTRLFPEDGPELANRIDAFIQGINAAQQKLCPEYTAPDCPVEYFELKKVPQPWTRADVVYVTSLLSGLLGIGGGNEDQNAIWLQLLRKRFGPEVAQQIFRDLQVQHDPATLTTVASEFRYEDTGPVNPEAVALLDPDAERVAATGDVLDQNRKSQNKSVRARKLPGALEGPFGKVHLPLHLRNMSNALVVGAAHSENGRPIAVYGCQTGYTVPEALTEIVLHGPNYAARGAAFVGLGFFVQLGRGLDYSWSATSGMGDVVDTVVHRLCNQDGSPARLDSEAYQFEGRCVAMDKRIQKVMNGKELLGSLQVLRTRYGIVQYRTLAGGVPVAVVRRRSTYGRDLFSVRGFARINDPNFVRDAATFQEAFHNVDYSFNWFYVDDRDIAYFNSGLLPLRASGVDVNLPYWGERRWEWKGWLDPKDHPQAINPPQGYLVSWNNKPARGWPASDSNQGWGAVHRAQLLDERIATALAKGKKISRAQLVGMMVDAATVDLRARYLLKDALEAVHSAPELEDELKMLRAWVDAGAHRVDRGSGTYEHQGAIALWDTWYPQLAHKALVGTLGEELTSSVPTVLDNPPYFTAKPFNLGVVGSAWDSVGFYSYLSRELGWALGRPLAAHVSRPYCGNGSRQHCKDQLHVSFLEAVRNLQATQGQDPGRWRYQKGGDDISFIPLGLVLMPEMPWQNRPTWQQVVNFGSHRPRDK